MTRRIYWGFAILIILLIGVSVVLLRQTTDTEPRTVYNPLTPEEAQVKSQIQDAIEKSKVPTARPGYKIVPHDDHYHEVKIDKTEDTTPVDKPVATVPKAKSGSLTYHEELLKTNPVEALRLQAEERGHPAAKWIPPFPPDDLEAQEFARNIYLSIYLDEAHPDSKKVGRAMLDQLDAINQYPHGARRSDLSRLIWINTDLPTHIYHPFPGFHPSDYFQSENVFIKKALEQLKENKIK